MRTVFFLFSLMLITGVFIQAQTVDVTFQADMNVKIATGFFDPSTEVVTCVGGFNNWLNEPPANTEKVMSDVDVDGVYTITITMDPNLSYEYKFNIGLDWDGKDELQGQANRSVVVADANMTVDPAFFNVVGTYSGVATNVTFNVDMRLPAQGDFDPTTDHVYVAGNFTDWQNAAVEMFDPEGDSTYTVAFDALTSGELLIYKFVHSQTDAPSGSWESPAE
ncbi:MAG: hypothetical protein O6940_05730, partial [Ignavibacteria bacterium]|nr:hypothetical protein [Ignavibacteria bacterium]